MKQFMIIAMLQVAIVCSMHGSIPSGNLQKANKMENPLPQWAFGGFIRPEGKNPIISPNPVFKFYCPMRQDSVAWMESDTFNPAAIVKDNKIYVLYRAEDNSAIGIGSRTSRIGLAESLNGVTMKLRNTPVLYPTKDNNKEFEWTGGCEDPRVAVTQDGLFVMAYTSWNRNIPRLCIATSRDLISWKKHGPAFAKAYNGKFLNLASKSASLVTKVINGKQIITKINGRYMMYWGERMINIATSTDLINWTPQLNSKNELKGIVFPRDNYFDSSLTECGPPAIITEKGIVLLYNGKNSTGNNCDKRFNKGTYSAGQILFDLKNPEKVIARLDVPFFRPMSSFEKSGQYVNGTVFIEGMVFFHDKWYLYYGCADSKVGVAIYDPSHPATGDPIE